MGSNHTRELDRAGKGGLFVCFVLIFFTYSLYILPTVPLPFSSEWVGSPWLSPLTLALQVSEGGCVYLKEKGMRLESLESSLWKCQGLMKRTACKSRRRTREVDRRPGELRFCRWK